MEVYGTDTPRPGNFAPRFGDTAEFIAAVNKAAGRDMSWFFDVYLYQAALPELVATQAGERLDHGRRPARSRSRCRWRCASTIRWPAPACPALGKPMSS
jgi:aminopeptidase N